MDSVQSVINLFLLNTSGVNIPNNSFAYYTNNWNSNNMSTSAPVYPCLTGGTDSQSITTFENWNWNNGRMVHLPYTGTTIDDKLYQIISLPDNTQQTYMITFDVVGNTSPDDFIYIDLNGSSGDTATNDGRYVTYIDYLPMDTGSTSGYTLSLVSTSGFIGSISNIKITSVAPTYHQLDLLDSESFSMNFQLMTDITTKGGTYSFNFDLVGDGNNLSQLSDVIDVARWFDSSDGGVITKNVFYNKTLPAGISIKDFPFMYGQLVLQQGVNNNGNKYITCFFTNELRSFADQVGDKKLIGNDLDINGENTYDLDFTEYNHYFTWNNIFASHDTTHTNITITGNTYVTIPNMYNNGKGFYYGFIDLDGPNSINLTETNKTLIQNIRPCIYINEIWQKIWDRTTYNCKSSFTGSTYFQSLVMPMTFDKTSAVGRNINGTADEEFNVALPNDFTGYGAKVNSSPSFTGKSLWTECKSNYYPPATVKTLPMNTIGITVLFQDTFINDEVLYNSTLCANPDSGSCAQPYWQVSISGNYDVGIKIGYNIWVENSGNQTYNQETDVLNVQVNLYKSRWGMITPGVYGNIVELISNNQTTISVPYTSPSNVFLFSNDKDLLAEASGVDLWAGDKIYAQVSIRGFQDQPPRNRDSKYWLDVKQNATLFYNHYNAHNYYEYGSWVDMQQLLPTSYSQMDFITDIMNMFNLVAQPVMGTNDILIEPWNDFYHMDNTFDYITWRGVDQSGNTINKIDSSGDLTIETIPDLLYQDVYFHYTDDTNDTNLANYSNKYTKVWGSQKIQNPYLTNTTKEIISNFSPTSLNTYGSTKWITSQIYNKDKQPEVLNIPADETFSKRILFRNKLVSPQIDSTGVLFVYGNYGDTENYSRTTHVIPPPSLPITYNFVLQNTGSVEWLGKDVIVVDNDDQSNIFFGVVNNWNSGTNSFDILISAYDTLHTGATSYPIGTTDFWEIRTITDNSFGYGSPHPYQPYVGPVWNPYLNYMQDLNWGVNNYYFVPNNTTDNLYDRFWKTKILTYINPNSKYITYKAWLTLQDIANIDFRKKIMIDNELYILNKISSWSPNSSCKIELIQLSDYPSYFSDNTKNWTSRVKNSSNIKDVSNNVIELFDKSTVTLTDGNSGITWKYANDLKNKYPLSSKGIITGKGNIINGTNYHITGDYNQVFSDNVVLLNSSYNYISSGLTNIFLFGINNQTINESNTWITSGSGGTSGTSGISGTSGTSGTSATSGTSGNTGTSGSSATSGTSGTSGNNGTSGTSGNNGVNGTSGTSGSSATSGTSGSSATSGTSGTSGKSGTSGSSGTSGNNGNDGTSGSSGKSGTSGSSGSSGTTPTYNIDPVFYYLSANTTLYVPYIVTSGVTVLGLSMSSGTSGKSGSSGNNGTSGSSATSGTSGTSGNTGTSGTSGNTGTSGTSGNTGTSGTSATSGTSGTAGTSGASSSIITVYTGTTQTFVSGDANTLCIFTSGSAVTATIPASGTTNFAVGTRIDVIQEGAGKVTFNGGTPSILSQGSNKSIGAQYVGITLIKRAQDQWYIIGNLIA